MSTAPSSLSVRNLAALATVLLVGALLCSFTRPAQAQDRLGPIVRIAQAVEAQALTPLPNAPANLAELAPERRNVFRPVFTKPMKDDKGEVTGRKLLIIECTDRAACNAEAARRRLDSYEPHTGLPLPGEKYELCTAYSASITTCFNHTQPRRQ